MPPTVLLVSFSFTGQTRRVAEAMAETFRSYDWNVVEVPLRLVDARYPLSLPWHPFWQQLLGWIRPQVLQLQCNFAVPEGFGSGPPHVDIVCIGSPTWWLLPAIPVTSFLRSTLASQLLHDRSFAVFAVARSFWRLNAWRVTALARRCGGRHIASRGFVFPGNQLQSFLTLAIHLKGGTSPARAWGIPLHPYGLAADTLRAAQGFAEALATGRGSD